MSEKYLSDVGLAQLVNKIKAIYCGYAVCSTAAATAAKAVSLPNFNLITGAAVKIKFTASNAAANPTLNINNSGGKAIYYKGATVPAAILIAGGVYEFVYNGSQYELLGGADAYTKAEVDAVTSGISTQMNSMAKDVPHLSALLADNKVTRYKGDLNLLEGTCIVYCDNADWEASHKPGNFNGFLFSIALAGYSNATGFAVQWYQQTGNNNLYLRYQNNGTWGDWNRVITSAGGNVDSALAFTKISTGVRFSNGTVFADGVDGSAIIHLSKAPWLTIVGNDGGSIVQFSHQKNTLLKPTYIQCDGNPAGLAFTGGNSGQLEIKTSNPAVGAASIAFHRQGQRALNFGIDIDNKLKIGGWNLGANTYEVWTDYNVRIENGTWTPSLTGDETSNAHVYATRRGIYRRIGNRVFLDFTLQLSSKGTTAGNLVIRGLPFAAKSITGSDRYSAYAGFAANMVGAMAGVGYYIRGGDQYIVVTGGWIGTPLSTQGPLNTNHIQNDTYILGSINYEIA